MTTANEQGGGAPHVFTSIETIEAHEAIRKRPGMYVGDIHDGSGLRNMVDWVLTSRIDEHRKRLCFRISVTLHRSGFITIEDDGPGIPLEGAFTTLFPDMALTVANALSDQLIVEVRRGGRLLVQEYARGVPRGCVADRQSAPEGAASQSGFHRGTRIVFRPDARIFPSTSIDGSRLLQELSEKAFINPGLEIRFVDERNSTGSVTFRTAGLADWVERMADGQESIPDRTFACRGEVNGIGVDAAFRWVWAPAERIRSFVNQTPTVDGPCVVGLKWGIARVLKRRSPPGLSFKHVGRGLVAVVSLEHPPSEWGASNRSVLREQDAKLAVRDVVERAFLEQIHDSELRTALLSRVSARQRLPPVAGNGTLTAGAVPRGCLMVTRRP